MRPPDSSATLAAHGSMAWAGMVAWAGSIWWMRRVTSWAKAVVDIASAASAARTSFLVVMGIPPSWWPRLAGSVPASSPSDQARANSLIQHPDQPQRDGWECYQNGGADDVAG